MIENINELLATLEQELKPSEIDMAQCTLYENQKQVNELKQGVEQGKNFSLLGDNN